MLCRYAVDDLLEEIERLKKEPFDTTYAINKMKRTIEVFEVLIDEFYKNKQLLNVGKEGQEVHLDFETKYNNDIIGGWCKDWLPSIAVDCSEEETKEEYAGGGLYIIVYKNYSDCEDAAKSKCRYPITINYLKFGLRLSSPKGGRGAPLMRDEGAYSSLMGGGTSNLRRYYHLLSVFMSR